MRKIVLVVFVTLLLVSCTKYDQTSNEHEEDNIKVVITIEEPIIFENQSLEITTMYAYTGKGEKIIWYDNHFDSIDIYNSDGESVGGVDSFNTIENHKILVSDIYYHGVKTEDFDLEPGKYTAKFIIKFKLNQNEKKIKEIEVELPFKVKKVS